MKEKNAIEQASQIIGSQSELARRLGISKSNITQWIKGRVPVERCLDIELITEGRVKCENLRPDIKWSVLRKDGQ